MKKIRLFIFICLSFIFATSDTVYAGYGKGWMKDVHLTDPSCSTWKLEISTYDTAGNPLTADWLNLHVNQWDASIGSWVDNIYSATLSNTQYHRSPCLSTGGDINDWFPVYTRASKAGFDFLDTSRKSESAVLSQFLTQRFIYLARNDEPINIAHISPIGNQVLTNSTVNFQVYYKKRVGSEDVNDVIHIDLDNIVTGERVSGGGYEISPPATEGTVSFPSVTLSDGFYSWNPVMWDFTGGNLHIYDTPMGEKFIVDTTPPNSSCSTTISGNSILVTLTENDTTSGVNPLTGDVDVRWSSDGVFDSESWTNDGLPNEGTTIDNFTYAHTPGLMYQFRYKVKDYGNLESSYSHCAIGTPPAPATNLSASCSDAGTTATVSWNPVPYATYYALSVNNTADGWDGTCSSSSGDFCITTSSNSYSFTTAPDSSYTWWVQACNTYGCSFISGGVPFSCAVPTPTPRPLLEIRGGDVHINR